jgi:predicted transcriptional regulator
MHESSRNNASEAHCHYCHMQMSYEPDLHLQQLRKTRSLYVCLFRCYVYLTNPCISYIGFFQITEIINVSPTRKQYENLNCKKSIKRNEVEL